MKEAEAAYSELEEARKQLKMKDLYLRQLGAYSSGDASSEHEFHNLHGKTGNFILRLRLLQHLLNGNKALEA